MRSLLGGKTRASVDFEHHLSELGLDMEEIEIGVTSPWAHRKVGEVEQESAGRLLAVAVLRKEGGTDLNPSPTTALLPGDALVVLKRGGR